MREHGSVRKWATLAILSLALAIIIIDTTLLNVSLSTLVREFDTNLQSLQWVISAYSLTLAALTVTGGRLGDLFGRKRMFMLGAIIFAVGSLITSFSTSIPMMIAGESIIEGIGAALMMPATASLVVANYSGHDRAIAFGIWGGVAAGASAIGPVLGGYLTTNFSWRWGFRINVVVVAILLAGSVLVGDSHERPKRPTLDLMGVCLSAVGLFLVVFGIIEASTFGWFLARQPFSIGGHSVALGPLSVTPLAIAAGVLVLAGFLLWERREERRGRTPLVSLRLFANNQFFAGAVTIAVVTLALMGLTFSIPVFLQSVPELDAFHTGLALAPLSGALLVISPLAASFSRRISPKHLVQAGLCIMFVGFAVLYFTLDPTTTALGILPGLVVFGTGMGMVMAQINNVTLSAVPVRESGEASGVAQMFRQLGSSLGAAIIGAVLLTTLVNGLEHDIARAGTLPPPARARVDAMLQKQASGLVFGSNEVFDHLPQAARPVLARSRKEETTAGNRRSLLYGAGFAVLGLLVSFKLPRHVREDGERQARD